MEPKGAAGRLQAAARELQIELPTPQQRQLLHFLAMLQRWNAVYNLTAVRDPTQMERLHLFDCLAIVGPLRREVRPFAGRRLLDVGSGAGLPGAVLAILEPELHVVCVDAVSKKAAFIRQVAAELGLSNLEARHARVEGLEEPLFDVIVARAFGTLTLFVNRTRPLLGSHGIWAAMKGRRPTGELDVLPRDVQVFHVEPLSVPDLEAERTLVWLRPLPAADATAVP